ncbi:MAG: hypothetical protein K5854_01735 [Prevotella sp.]|nr:hypothetical protein [Prevotella sp.]
MEKADLIFHNFQNLALSCIECSLEPFRGVWGRYGTKAFTEKSTEFGKVMMLIAKKSDLRYADMMYYIYDGETYVPLDESDIRMGYELLILHYGIANYMTKVSNIANFIMMTVKSYNKMERYERYLAFPNGVLDLDSLEFHKEFSKDYHVIRRLPYKYNPKAKCGRFFAFLGDVVPSKTQREVLQMYLGLALTQRDMVFKDKNGAYFERPICLFLYGRGDCGRGVLKHVVEGVLGAEGVTSYDYKSFSNSGRIPSTNRRLMHSAMLNWATDTRCIDFRKHHPSLFKQIICGKPVPEKMMGNTIKYSPSLPFMVFAVDDLPERGTRNDAFLRDIQLISFSTIPADKRNPNLALNLCGEYPGVLNWIINGAKKIRENKFVFPRADETFMRYISVRLRKEPVSAWVETYGIRPVPLAPNETGVLLKVQFLLDSINRYLRENGAPEIKDKMLAKRLREAGFLPHRKTAGLYFKLYGATSKSLRSAIRICDMDKRIINNVAACIDADLDSADEVEGADEYDDYDE